MAEHKLMNKRGLQKYRVIQDQRQKVLLLHFSQIQLTKNCSSDISCSNKIRNIYKTVSVE